MILFILLWLSYHFLGIITAYDNFEGGFKLEKPCFEVFEHKDCHSSIPAHFTAKNELFGSNEPNTSVFLFTPLSRHTAEQLHLCGGYLPPDSKYDPKAETEVFIHGWLDGICRTAWMREMKEQLFERGKYNVILVDWTWGNLDFQSAGLNSRIVGEQVGFVIKNIMERTGCGPENFHLIGHSFGAIASGFTGRSLKSLLRRITALDPAGAPYFHAPPDGRLTYRDAQIVDVIHSNSAHCWAIGVGDDRPLGHADFYVNGGLFQSSCYTYIIISLLKGDLLSALASLEPRICSHLQSLQYYKVSINPKGDQFVGVASCSNEAFEKRNNSRCRLKCCQIAIMGMDFEKYERPRNRKKYFLTTTDTCPYYDYGYLGPAKSYYNVTCLKKSSN